MDRRMRLVVWLAIAACSLDSTVEPSHGACNEESGGDAKVGSDDDGRATTDADGGTSGGPSTSGDAGSSGDAGLPEELESSSSSGGATPGQVLYEDMCAVCHGEDALGTAAGYELRHPVREHSTWVLRNGRPGLEFENSAMVAFDTDVVPDELLEEVWDYLDAFPQPETGEGLYHDYCGNCHGPEADGGSVDQDVTHADRDEIWETVRDGKHTSELGERHEYMPAFDETVLTDDEIDLIVDFVEEL